MGTKENESLRRLAIEQAYEHPAPLLSARLSFEDCGDTRRRLASLARLAGFEVGLFGSVGWPPPSWHKRHPEDAQLAYWSERTSMVTLQGWRQPPTLGLMGFDVLYAGTRPPVARLKFASWPWRRGNVTELTQLLKADIERTTRL